ncbi:PAS domain-containing hybrid sensor histidine kinase/response regulator [Mucilaginibacter paludis]|uniref:histidine kinase n=1 Tax=Mucilaginibacter paludis DSM 18603 TaxID=714943 RepID=H1Y9L7_9SPHI|nr:PAS domain S-box protein [Mucilaginibacter paludis]EHQ30519.1 PAS/PAC sensor hybrid histidine kinase [Mucilaginibacter paludis DSM 18603]
MIAKVDLASIGPVPSQDIQLCFFQCKLNSAGEISILNIDQNCWEVFGINRDDIIADAHNLLALIEYGERELLTGHIYRALNSLTNFEWHGMVATPAGWHKQIKAVGQCSGFENEVLLNGVFADLTILADLRTAVNNNNQFLSQASKLAKIATWEIDLQTGVVKWSDGMSRLHEMQPGGMIDIESAIVFYEASSRLVFKEALDKALTVGEPYHIELQLLTAKGNLIWVRSSGSLMMEKGKPYRLCGVLQDITEQKQIEERNSVIFEQSTDAHLLIDETGIIDCNNAAVQMLRCENKAHLLSCHPAIFSPEYQPDGQKSIDKAKKMDSLAYEKGTHRFEWVHQRMDGKEIFVEVTLNAIAFNQKRVLLVVWHDITQRKKAEEKLKRNESLLSETQALTHSGSWEIDLKTGRNFWSAEAFRIFGLEPVGAGPDTEEFDRMIHPDDREKYINAIKQALKGGLTSNFDLRIILKTGELKYIQAIGKPFYNDQGVATRLYGAIIDITKYKKAEEAILMKQAQLNTFIEVSPAPIAVFDKEMRYIAASDLWKQDYKLERKNIIGVCHYDLFPEASLHWRQIHERGMAGEILSNTEDSFVRKNGRTQWFRWEIRPWFETDKEIGGIIMFTEIITDRKLAEQALIQAKEQAENAASAKTQFLSTMSHEIRTPMNAVIGFTHLLLQNPREDQVEYLKILKFSGENLLVLINDILDFSKIEAGKLEFEHVDFNLKDLVRNIRAAMQQRAIEKGIQLKLLVDEDLPQAVIGDPVRLGQILSNLISNALKFTSVGKVVVSASLVSRNNEYTIVSFEVKDTGIGIPTEKQQAIFESFTQASSDTTRKYGGTGLGLTITKRLLEMQGSAIQLDSEPGKGSTFSFNLQFKNSELQPEALNVIQPPGIQGSLKGIRILLAEDNQINVLLARQFLKQWDVECDVAENGLMAVELAQSNLYDVILMDLQMPEMDGYTAAEQIRNLQPAERFRKLPIIALTASAMLDNKDKAFVVGMNDYISKPFNPDELYRKIAYYSKKSKNSR